MRTLLFDTDRILLRTGDQIIEEINIIIILYKSPVLCTCMILCYYINIIMHMYISELTFLRVVLLTMPEY